MLFKLTVRSQVISDIFQIFTVLSAELVPKYLPHGENFTDEIDFECPGKVAISL